MSYTAVSAAARGLVFTQSLLFLMAVSSDESGTHEGVRQQYTVAYSVPTSLSFKLKKRIYGHFEPLGEIYIHKSHLYFAI